MRLFMLTIALIIFISPVQAASPNGKALQCSEQRTIPEGKAPAKVFYSNIKASINFSFENGHISQYFVDSNNSISKRRLFYRAKSSTISIYGQKPGICESQINRQTLFIKTCNLYQRCVLTTKDEISNALTRGAKKSKSKVREKIKKNKI